MQDTKALCSSVTGFSFFTHAESTAIMISNDVKADQAKQKEKHWLENLFEKLKRYLNHFS